MTAARPCDSSVSRDLASCAAMSGVLVMFRPSFVMCQDSTGGGEIISRTRDRFMFLKCLREAGDYGPDMTFTDRATLDRILRDYAGLAHRLAASYESDPEAARDLTQEILVAVWRAWPAFRHQCAERTYVARIAHYRIATHVGRAVREPRRAPLDDDMASTARSPEDEVMQHDLREHLVALVRTLPVAYREVALLLLEDFTPHEVAETLGISANAVAIRGSRAREMLRALLEQRP